MSDSSSRQTLPAFPSERLSGFDVDVLTDLLHLHEDRLPRTVVDECACRGEPMVDALAALAKDGSYWRDDTASGEWWALLHAVMVLGLIPGERAGEALVAFMRRIDQSADDGLEEWLDGCWPAFFANKPASVLATLRALALDRNVGWYMRIQAIDSVIAAAERRDERSLDESLDWACSMAADETEIWDLRLMSALTVLSFARDRHRPLLEALARRQSRREAAFNLDDIAKAYAGTGSAPDWHGREEPWRFYDPTAIAERQDEWARQEAEDAPAEEDIVSTYVRETPKVGRNDPCPCGSGKKYKQCCLTKSSVH